MTLFSNETRHTNLVIYVLFTFITYLRQQHIVLIIITSR